MKAHPYFGRNVVLTSKHFKKPMIEPIFRELLDINIIECAADTDLLGTFSGEIERKLPPLETALQKARIGLEQLGMDLGIASEGSIGPDPVIPFLKSDVEIIVLVDLVNELEIVEVFRTFDICAVQKSFSLDENLDEFLIKANFPNHKLIVRANSGEKSSSIKGIGDRAELENAIELMAKNSMDGKVSIESDLRAYCSPSRASNIEKAAKILAMRVKQQCRLCNSPGWGKVGMEKGLECQSCGAYVEKAIKREVFGCFKCDYREFGDQLSPFADPEICDWCNP